jgi:hypothetical protein
MILTTWGYTAIRASSQQCRQTAQPRHGYTLTVLADLEMSAPFPRTSSNDNGPRGSQPEASARTQPQGPSRAIAPAPNRRRRTDALTRRLPKTPLVATTRQNPAPSRTQPLDLIHPLRQIDSPTRRQNAQVGLADVR